MEFEFDKEIDAILRKAREGEFVFADNLKSENQNPKLPHLDADTLSAFAEKALPEKSKKLYTAHLADCDRCRRILSNLILLNAEEEILPVIVTERKIVETQIPWYRKLFAAPNLVYTFGALVLVFSGFAAYFVLQNTLTGTSSEISQSTETKPNAKGPSAIENSDNFNANAVSNTASSTANTSANTAANLASNTASISTNSASNAASNAANAANTVSNVSNKELTKSVPMASAPTPPPPPVAADGASDMGEIRSESKTKPEELSAARSAETPSVPKPILPSKRREDEENKALRNTRDAQTDKSEKKIAGKTFRRVDSAWVDSEYHRDSNQQSNMMLPPLTRISRGSNEYKKLDSGLRNIADQLDGIVIVIWKSKGYRIQ